MEMMISKAVFQTNDFPFFCVKNTENGEVILLKTESKEVKDFIELECTQELFEVQTEMLREKNVAEMEGFSGKEIVAKTPLQKTIIGKTFNVFHDFLGQTFCVMEFPSKNLLIFAGGYKTTEKIADFKGRNYTNLAKLSEKLPKKKFSAVEKECKKLHREVVKSLFSKDEEEFMELVKFLRADFSKRYSMEDLAKKFFSSSRTIQRKTQQYMNQEFGVFYRTLRMSYVKKLLLKEEHTMEEIAEMTGYSSVRALHRAFKQIYGVTPKDYLLEMKCIVI